MRKLIYFLIIITVLGCKESNNEKTVKSSTIQDEIKIEINENVETVGIILSLSGLGDYVLSNSSDDRNYEFIRLLRKRFKDYKNHTAILKFNDLNKLNLAHFNHYYYGLSFSKLPEFKLIHPKYSAFYTSDKFNRKQVDSILMSFDNAIRDFYIDAKLNEYFNNNELIYKKIKAETQSAIPNNIISTMENYYGKYENNYIICPSLAIPNNWNFGADIINKVPKDFYYLTGPSYDLKPKRESINSITKNDSLGFNDKEYIAYLAIHEFGHSFVRFLDKKENKALIEKLAYLNTNELKKNLEKIGEGTGWSTGFEEHLVRASEVMIWRNLGKREIADEKLIFDRENEGLLYMDEFVNSLEKYERKRDEYITLESYFTELVSDLMNIKNK